MGVFKRLEDVPEADRLSNYAERYADSDPWSEFLVTELLPTHNSYQFKQTARLAARRWKAHVQDRGRHHALATPTDVETWCTELLVEVEPQTVYKSYWTKIERFYEWLRWHTDHPHAYNPVLMAAANKEAAGTVWETKMEFRER
ncbi:hypothetical protein [Haloglomus halophilum]|jgi:hypothetical protein|uniref:hypothetical protein n=1 Tax=Haloglomus halophilum TaxID=2962672 RepID=UPI0020C98493|nr:hypothetical protein [Haloglomus halophilum]